MSCRPTAGTKAGYQRHLRAGEPVCDACRSEARIYWRTHPSQPSRLRVGGHNPGGAPLLILDIVEANQPVGALELSALVDASVGTIRRAMYRLIDAGQLQKTGAVLTLPEQGDPT